MPFYSHSPIGFVKSIFRNLVFKNFAYLILAHFFSQLLMFLAYSFLARKISVENFGKFGFAQAFYTYFLLLLDLGLPVYGIKKFVLLESEQEKVTLINRIISTRFFLLVLLLLPFLGGATLIAGDLTTRNLILLMGFALVFMTFNLEWYFRAVQRMGVIAVANIAKSAFFFLAVWLFVEGDGHTAYLGLYFALAFLLYMLIFLATFPKRTLLRIYIDLSWMWPIIKESAILGLSFMLIQVYYNFGILVLGLTRPPEEVGYYTTIYKLLMVFLVVISIYLKAVFPHLATLADRREQLANFIIRLTRWSLLLSLLVAASIILIAEPLLVFVFGEKYAPGAFPFKILMLTFVVIATRTLIENSLIITDKSQQYLLAVAVGAGSNIVFNLIFTPLYGIVATAVVTVFSEIVLAVVAIRFSDIRFGDIFKWGTRPKAIP